MLGRYMNIDNKPELDPETHSVVSHRGVADIMPMISMDEQILDLLIKEGDTIVDIGSGLSDFPNYLAERYEPKNVAVYSVDPAFETKELAEATAKDLQGMDGTVVSSVTGKNYFIRADFRKDKKIYDKGTVHRIPGYMKSMPFFADNSIPLIICNKVVEHTKFDQDIPELARCLREDGEIRIGGAHTINVVMDGNDDDDYTGKYLITQPVNYFFDSSDYTQEFYLTERGDFANMAQTISWAIENRLKVYCVTTSSPSRHMEYGYLGQRIAATIIIRKDDKLPLTAQSHSEENKDGTLDRLYRITNALSREQIDQLEGQEVHVAKYLKEGFFKVEAVESRES